MRESLDVARRAATPLRLRRTSTLGVIVDSAETLEDVVDLFHTHLVRRTPLLVTFVNPGSRAVARAKRDFLGRLEAFDAVLPDGIGMSMAIRILHRLPAARISFDMTSLAPEVMTLAERYHRTIVLVGGVGGSAERAGRRLEGSFPNLRVIGVFDGYGDIDSRAADIAALDPDIVVAGMGAGAQEAMLLALKAAGWTGCGFTCGGFFDQLSDRAEYYPSWVDRYQLRWAYRLSKEPRRLWRRYLLTYPPFFGALAFEAFAGGVQRRLRFGAVRGRTRPTIGGEAGVPMNVSAMSAD